MYCFHSRCLDRVGVAPSLAMQSRVRQNGHLLHRRFVSALCSDSSISVFGFGLWCHFQGSIDDDTCLARGKKCRKRGEVQCGLGEEAVPHRLAPAAAECHRHSQPEIRQSYKYFRSFHNLRFPGSLVCRPIDKLIGWSNGFLVTWLYSVTRSLNFGFVPFSVTCESIPSFEMAPPRLTLTLFAPSA